MMLKLAFEEDKNKLIEKLKDKECDEVFHLFLVTSDTIKENKFLIYHNVE